MFEAQRAENKAEDRTVFAECPLCTVTVFQNIFTGKKVLLIFPHRPVFFHIVQYYFKYWTKYSIFFEYWTEYSIIFKYWTEYSIISMISYKALNTRTQILGHAFWNYIYCNLYHTSASLRYINEISAC